MEPAEGNEVTIHTGLKGQRYGQQQSSHFLDDVMYDELCKVMCYADLMADKDSPEAEQEPPRISLGSPILDTCNTALPLLAQIEMDPSWRRVKMMNHTVLQVPGHVKRAYADEPPAVLHG